MYSPFELLKPLAVIHFPFFFITSSPPCNSFLERLRNEENKMKEKKNKEKVVEKKEKEIRFWLWFSFSFLKHLMENTKEKKKLKEIKNNNKILKID